MLHLQCNDSDLAVNATVETRQIWFLFNRFDSIISINITTTWTIFNHFYWPDFFHFSQYHPSNAAEIDDQIKNLLIFSPFAFFCEVCPFNLILKLSLLFTSRWAVKRNRKHVLPFLLVRTSLILLFSRQCYTKCLVWNKWIFSQNHKSHLSADLACTHKSFRSSSHKYSFKYNGIKFIIFMSTLISDRLFFCHKCHDQKSKIGNIISKIQMKSQVNYNFQFAKMEIACFVRSGSIHIMKISWSMRSEWKIGAAKSQINKRGKKATENY